MVSNKFLTEKYYFCTLKTKTMRTSFLKLIQTSLFLVMVIGMLVSPVALLAQEGETNEQDTIEVIEDNSSAFNDSVQFDDMEPVFYEAAEEEAPAESEGGMGTMLLYVGIAVVLIIVLIVLKKAGKKKA